MLRTLCRISKIRHATSSGPTTSQILEDSATLKVMPRQFAKRLIGALCYLWIMVPRGVNGSIFPSIKRGLLDAIIEFPSSGEPPCKSSEPLTRYLG